MAQLSEWLQLMLAEIARKQEEALRASEEQDQRQQEARQPDTRSSPEYLSTQT
jgi:hypothetical protein